ncbi:DEAD/DEAH box helicase [Bdellovibrio sp. HCB337]|uniref:DEAD/DEAH box helicase n=1 Tax=Bdellovibrio sp. HCB337 TaxID=3394358 RepID=UPI0039A66C75
MSLFNISQLRDPSERVPLGERIPYEQGLKLIEGGGFEGYELHASPEGHLQSQIFWHDDEVKKRVVVKILEEKPHGPLAFSCSACVVAGRQAQSCSHQWASYVLLWQAAQSDTSEIQHPELKKFSEELKGPQFLGALDDVRSPFAEFDEVTLDSMSLFLEEPPLLKGPALGTLLNHNFSKYKNQDFAKDKELLSPRLWNLPEVFRKKLSAYSEHYFNEVNNQNRIAGMLAYNFSNGMQINSRDILRHPLHKKVPGELLPQGKTQGSVFAQWPLTPQSTNTFVSHALQELEEIVQALLANVAKFQRQKKIELYLQTKNQSGKALKIQAIEFEPSQEVDWRVEFVERKELESEFRLMSFRKTPMYFFESYAVEATEGVIVVHPWLREFSLLQETLSGLSNDLMLQIREMPVVDVLGELETKMVLKYLRGRAIPVKISGESRTLSAQQSQTEIRMDENGGFYVQHEARVQGQKNLVRKGWTTKSALYLQTLSQGLPFLLNTEAKEIATRSRSKREWDMKILKHLGILQYVYFEVLSWHFQGELSDGRIVGKEEIFSSLHERVQSLLIAGSGGIFVKDVPLTELCSKSVLACFEDFVNLSLKAVSVQESFYSEHGEVIMEGVVEREFQLLFELLKRLVVVSNGEVFKRSRTSILSKISKDSSDDDLRLARSTFFFPSGDTQSTSSVQSTIEALQPLIPKGFKVYFKDQALQELEEDEFHVDFLLQSESDDRSYNWFELNPKFFLRGEEVDPDRFLSLGRGGVIEYEGKLFLVPQKQMPSLRRLEFFWQKLQKGKVESSKKKNGERVFQLPRHQTLELLALRASGVQIRGDHEWNELCEFYDGLGSAKRDLSLPKSMKAELKPYQFNGVKWLQDLYRLRLGALLADDMGLGKTLQTLAFLDDLRDKGELGQVLIVVPSSLIFNWQHEVQKFTPDLPLTVFSNKDRDVIGKKLGHKEDCVVITTYGLLMEHEDFLNQFKWKVVIFDEAQNLKNITTKRTSAARSLTAQFKICLTGTPMENHYGEFYSLVDILVPGSLGRIEDFRRQFVNTEMVTREEMQDLKLKIKPLLLRRTKKEILDQLPEKQETKVSIAFEDRQKEIYRDIAMSYNHRVKEAMAVQGEASVQLQMLTALLRLRQACSDPAALPNVRYDKVPPKLEALMDSLQEIVESGESALVFTQFLQTLQHTAELLKNSGIPVFVLHGGIPTKQRQKILAEFNNTPGGAVLVMTLKTGGVGLNLTKASYVFHLEPWWNPSVENQATDRAHRLGQTKAVQVFRYIMHESLEEKIELLKDRKDRKFQSLFTTTEKEVEVGAGGSALSKDDFDLLLGIK